MRPSDKVIEPKMDAKDLYREEVFTDRKVGTIRQLTPVKVDGTADTARPMLFVGQAQLLTTMGALPLNFEINARSLEEATQKFSDAAKVAVERTLKELQEMRREAASSIIVPEGMPPGGFGGPGGVPGGGMPGGGKIKLP
jgi:hypothetical protein